jgi:hypothetical protein
MKFGNLTAIEGLTPHVDEEQVFGFLAPNVFLFYLAKATIQREEIFTRWK